MNEIEHIVWKTSVLKIYIIKKFFYCLLCSMNERIEQFFAHHAQWMSTLSILCFDVLVLNAFDVWAIHKLLQI